MDNFRDIKHKLIQFLFYCTQELRTAAMLATKNLETCIFGIVGIITEEQFKAEKSIWNRTVAKNFEFMKKFVGVKIKDIWGTSRILITSWLFFRCIVDET